MKVFIVTAERQVSKKQRESHVVGFVSTFGWESPIDKAAKKYPNLGNFTVHGSRFFGAKFGAKTR